MPDPDSVQNKAKTRIRNLIWWNRKRIVRQELQRKRRNRFHKEISCRLRRLCRVFLYQTSLLVLVLIIVSKQGKGFFSPTPVSWGWPVFCRCKNPPQKAGLQAVRAEKLVEQTTRYKPLWIYPVPAVSILRKISFYTCQSSEPLFKREVADCVLKRRD